MPTVTIESQGDITVIRLDHGVTNAINPEMLAELDLALVRARENSRGLMLAGGDKFFSIGFDLPVLLKLDRPEFTEFWRSFNRTFIDIYTLPIPTVCALTGHAVAGGAVLSLAPDFRIGASGNKQIGLNEIRLGIPVPYSTDLVLRQLVGDRAATDMIYSGDFITTSEAMKFGLVDEVTEMDSVEQRALEKLQTLAAQPQPAFVAIKQNRTEAVTLQYNRLHAAKDEIFLDAWFSESVQVLLAEAAKTF
jgi:enoyl-CoA hydratase/carnithine racemase